MQGKQWISFTLISLAIIFIIILFLQGFKFNQYFRFKKTKWETIPATIVSSEVKTRTKSPYLQLKINQYRPHVCFKYNYKEKEHKNCSQFPYSGSEKEAENQVVNYPENTEIKVLVNPDNPSEVFLAEKNITIKPFWIQMTDMVIFSAMILYVLIL